MLNVLTFGPKEGTDPLKRRYLAVLQRGVCPLLIVNFPSFLYTLFMRSLPDLPVSSYIPQIAETLKQSPSRFLILTAETGAGKSTVIPAGLSDYFQGKILMTEPRRIAALSIAERVSEILQEPCGKTCGYKIHLENRVSKDTQMEIVTEAILSRTLQSDPSLDGYSVVIIDEFHERSVTSDLNLAFLKEAMELRDDLFVIIMSATIETKKLSEFLSNSAFSQGGQTPISNVPVMEIPGRTFPVQVEYKNEETLINAVFQELNREEPVQRGQTPHKNKVILIFLPGIREIRDAENELKNALINSKFAKTEIHVLHSSISISDQKKIFLPLPENTNRIIISSAIAETSLTVPGVTTVIDSGLSRVNKLNIALGMETLVTEAESEFSAEQRKGRAGRLQEGRCIRLWNKNEPRQKSMLPEILRTDISQLVLECAAWGKNLFESENFLLDSPSRAAIKTSTEFLQNMFFLDKEKKITERGRLALESGVSPRLASLILFASENPLLEEEAIKLILKYSNYSEAKLEMQKKFCEDIQKKIQRARVSYTDKKCTEKNCSKASLLFAGFPDRLAKKTKEVSDTKKVSYQFPNGHTAILSKDLTYQQAPEWLIAPEVLATKSGGTIFEYEAISPQETESLIKESIVEETVCFFNDDQTKVNKFVYTKYGKITLSERRLNVTQEDSALAWCTQIQQKGLKSLKLSYKIQDFLTRTQFYFDYKQPGIQSQADVYSKLQENPTEWLTPFLNDGKLTDEVLFNAMYWYLNGTTIDENVPTQITLPNGRRAKISYELNSSPDDKTKLIIRPVIEIIIQRIFGCFENPKIMRQPVLLKLLSPASRPLQITDDLAGFWNGSWIEICKEMKGRYPKHNWDYRVAEKD